MLFCSVFFFSSRRRHTRFSRDWSSDVCSSDLFGLLRPELNTNSLYVEWGIALLLLLALGFTKENQSRYYASFFVEGIPIVWWIGLLLVYEKSSIFRFIATFFS